jgi:hypothetical protein
VEVIRVRDQEVKRIYDVGDKRLLKTRNRMCLEDLTKQQSGMKCTWYGYHSIMSRDQTYAVRLGWSDGRAVGRSTLLQLTVE